MTPTKEMIKEANLFINEFDFFKSDKRNLDQKTILFALKLTEKVLGEPSQKQCSAGVSVYEQMSGGDRLPDGEGYDLEITGGIFKAMIEQAVKEVSDD